MISISPEPGGVSTPDSARNHIKSPLRSRSQTSSNAPAVLHTAVDMGRTFVVSGLTQTTNTTVYSPLLASGRSRSSGDGAGEWTLTKFGTIRTVPQLRHQLHHLTWCRYIAQTWALLRHYRGRRHSKTKVPQNDCHRSCQEERSRAISFARLVETNARARPPTSVYQGS